MKTSNNWLTQHVPKTCECSESAGEWRTAFKQQQMNNNNTLTLTVNIDFKCQQHTPEFCHMHPALLLRSKIICTAVIFATFPCCPQMLSRIQVIFTTSNAALPIFLSILTCCYPSSSRTLVMFAISNSKHHQSSAGAWITAGENTKENG